MSTCPVWARTSQLRVIATEVSGVPALQRGARRLAAAICFRDRDIAVFAPLANGNVVRHRGDRQHSVDQSGEELRGLYIVGDQVGLCAATVGEPPVVSQSTSSRAVAV